MSRKVLNTFNFFPVSALPGSPAKGDTVVLSSDGHLYTYDGAAWVDNGAAGGGGGTVYPLPIPTSTQAVWYIDASTGNDADDGLTSGTALATWKELGKRINGKRITQQTVINVLSGTPISDPVYLDVALDCGGGYFVITGIDGVTTTPRVGTASNDTVYTTNTRASVTAPSGAAMTPGTLIKGSNDALHWVCRSSGLVSYLDEGCDVNLIPPTFNFPSVSLPPTTSYSEVSLPRVYVGQLKVTQYDSGASYLLIDSLDIGRDGSLDTFEPHTPTLGFAVMTRCRVRSLTSGFIQCAGWNAIKCYFDYFSGQSPSSYGFLSWCANRATEIHAGCSLVFANTTFSATSGGSRYNEALKLMPGATVQVQNCGFFDGAANGVVLSAFSNLHTAGAIYGGSNAGSGVLFGAKSSMTLTQRPTLSATTANYSYTDYFDTSSKLWSSFALSSPYTSISNPPSTPPVGSVVVDFGVRGTIAETTVVDTSVTSSTVIIPNINGSTVDYNDYVHSVLPAYARAIVNPGVGFTIRVNSEWQLTGTVNVSYIRG